MTKGMLMSKGLLDYIDYNLVKLYLQMIDNIYYTSNSTNLIKLQNLNRTKAIFKKVSL